MKIKTKELTPWQTDFLNPKEVCEYLKISKATLWRWLDNGKIPQPTKRLSRSIILWRKTEIDDFLGVDNKQDEKQERLPGSAILRAEKLAQMEKARADRLGQMLDEKTAEANKYILEIKAKANELEIVSAKLKRTPDAKAEAKIEKLERQNKKLKFLLAERRKVAKTAKGKVATLEYQLRGKAHELLFYKNIKNECDNLKEKLAEAQAENRTLKAKLYELENQPKPRKKFLGIF